MVLLQVSLLTTLVDWLMAVVQAAIAIVVPIAGSIGAYIAMVVAKGIVRDIGDGNRGEVTIVGVVVLGVWVVLSVVLVVGAEFANVAMVVTV